LLFVLDSNEYLFALGVTPSPSCAALLNRLISSHQHHRVRVPRLIITEVRRHLSAETFREFLSTVQFLTSIDEDLVVPFELGVQYEARGLKPADAFIAAYTEWVGADALVSENRHFLSLRSDLSFRVLTAEQCLKLL
jgi:predicted nucleic acid-binding protein